MTLARFWAIGSSSEITIRPPKSPTETKGKGKGGSNWTGRDGGGGIGGGKKKGGLIYPAESPQHVMSAYRTAAGTYDATSPIPSWTDIVNDGSALNTTTGEWTAPYTGPFLFYWAATRNASGTGVNNISLYEDGVKIKTGGFDYSDGTTSTNVTPAMWYMHECVSGRKYTIRHETNATFSEYRWSICNVYSSVYFQMVRSAKFGSYGTAAYVTGFDSKVEYTANHSGYADTTTGVFTAPVTGPYLLWASGRDGAMNPATYADMWLYLSTQGGAFGHYTYRAGSKRVETGSASCFIVWLEAGQWAAVYKTNQTPGDLVFGGMLLHPNAHYIAANHWAGTTTAVGNNSYRPYTGVIGSTLALTGWNASTGTLTIPVGMGTRHWMGSSSLMPTGATQDYSSRLQMNGAFTYNKSYVSWNATNIRGHMPAGQGRSMTEGTIINHYIEQAINASYGYLCAWTPWGSDQV